MKPKNAFYAQSGGVTAVINASAAGVIETARKHRNRIGKVYAGRDGIIGALTEDLIDTSREPASAISRLKTTPGGAFGSCRYKLKGIDENRAHYERLIEVFRAHDIGYFFYNGGNDSADTAWKISQVGEKLGYPLICVGIPKTVDNDLAVTDNCPGFGSVAKYVATSIREAGFDVASMAKTSTRVFVMEVMGRHAGWITAACGLAADREGDAPQVLLFPEIQFDEEKFLARVKSVVERDGYCAIAVSEGLRNREGQFLSETGLKDAFGHSQLGGAGEIIAKLVKDRLKYKYHWALADYLQRSARHIASRVDVEQSYKLGVAAVKLALAKAPRGGEKGGSPNQGGGVKKAVSVAHRRCESRRHRQQGKDDAARFHHRRRVSHHAEMPHLHFAADPGRGAAAIQERFARLRQAEERACSQEASGLQALGSSLLL